MFPSTSLAPINWLGPTKALTFRHHTSTQKYPLQNQLKKCKHLLKTSQPCVAAVWATKKVDKDPIAQKPFPLRPLGPQERVFLLSIPSRVSFGNTALSPDLHELPGEDRGHRVCLCATVFPAPRGRYSHGPLSPLDFTSKGCMWQRQPQVVPAEPPAALGISAVERMTREAKKLMERSDRPILLFFFFPLSLSSQDKDD